MAKVSKVGLKSDSCHQRFTPLIFHSSRVLKDVHNKKKGPKALEKKEWKHATCSVCMEYPHNAVLILCSSYNKGCCPYMCATSHRYSNCLEQYKNAYTKVTSNKITEPWHGPTDISGFNLGSDCFGGKVEISELLCPLCRGQVKGWTVVEEARKYLNTKGRTCMKDNCSYIGTYKELRKHVRAEHPCARPREVDPTLAEKWNSLEQEREREDAISMIRSSTPGAIVLGNYVIEMNYHGVFGDYNVVDHLGDAIFRWQSFDGDEVDRVDSDESLESSYGSMDMADVANHDGNLAASGHSDDNYGSRFSRYCNRFLTRRLSRRRSNGRRHRATSGSR